MRVPFPALPASTTWCRSADAGARGVAGHRAAWRRVFD